MQRKKMDKLPKWLTSCKRSRTGGGKRVFMSLLCLAWMYYSENGFNLICRNKVSFIKTKLPAKLLTRMNMCIFLGQSVLSPGGMKGSETSNSYGRAVISQRKVVKTCAGYLL